jgi:hypothetical protein
MEEYRVLYTLVTFRMTSLDRRVPIATAALATFLGSIATLPQASQQIFLIGLPLAQVWLVRTTINHARSFEDVLRRIDEIERKVNELTGEEQLVFQSRHPSGGKATGGRTGAETVRTVYTTSLLMLGACAYLAQTTFPNPDVYLTYAFGCGVIALHLTVSVFHLRRYRYLKARSSEHPRGRRHGRCWPRRSIRGRRQSRAGTGPGNPLPSTGPSEAGTASDRQRAGTEAGTTAAPSAPDPC